MRFQLPQLEILGRTSIALTGFDKNVEGAITEEDALTELSLG